MLCIIIMYYNVRKIDIEKERASMCVCPFTVYQSLLSKRFAINVVDLIGLLRALLTLHQRYGIPFMIAL